MSDKLSILDAESAVSGLVNWSGISRAGILFAIEREFNFVNFRESFSFTTEVALLSESCFHHPNFRVSYGIVVLRLSSHDVGGLSSRDIALAIKIDKIFSCKVGVGSL